MTFCSPLPMFLNTNDTKWPKRLFACPSGDFEMAWLSKRIKDPQRKQVRLTSKPCSRDQRHQPLSQPPSLQQKLPLKICRTKIFGTLTTCNFQPNRKIHRIPIVSLYTPQKKSLAHLIDFLCRKVMHFIAPARDQGPWDLKWQKKKRLFQHFAPKIGLKNQGLNSNQKLTLD